MKRIFLPVLIFFSSLFLYSCQNTNSEDSVTAVSQSNGKIPALFERKGPLANAIEWPKTKTKVAELNTKISANPNDVKSRLQLATIYITEARITGEHPYYYPAILNILDGVLAIDSRNFDATVLKASVKLSQHKFSEAKALAEQAQSLNASNAYVYGILVDANVELGNYEEAIAASDKMQALKPSLESYARASYLREIYGDKTGAIDAMLLAVRAGLPGSEPQSWSAKTLAELYINNNELEKAEMEYKKILSMRPSYAFAIAGLAKIEEKRKNYDVALRLLDSAAAIIPEFSFYESMGDIYKAKGDEQKATQLYNKVKEMLIEDEKSGHLVSLEMAKLYVKMNMLESAKKYALMEYAARPKNIEVNKELAWITFLEKDIKKSREYLQAAKRTGTKDPELLERAALIEKS